MEKRLPTEPEKLGLLIFHTDNPHRLYNELAQEIGYWRVPRVWHEACAWFDSMEFTDDTLPPPPDTTVSGYSVQFPQPDGPPCPVCNDTGENCPHCPPHDEALYIADWSGRVERGELDGYDEAAGLTGYERLMEAPHE